MTSLVLQTGAAENIKRYLPENDEENNDDENNDPRSDNDNAADDVKYKLLNESTTNSINYKNRHYGGGRKSSDEDGGTIRKSSVTIGCGSMELAFSNVSVTVASKPLLSSVNGKAKSSELLAIMGPSGAGKTTLLNSLAGRLPLSSGEITLNGTPIDKGFKRKVSYVLQEDIFFPNLTLKETLNFIAMIRLPEKMPKEDKLYRVEEVVGALDLQKCQDTIMGDAWCRGLSGGEKKRASIAGELITDPKIIYLDEPTSGLDYSSALSLVTILKRVALQMDKIVVLTIHQPSSRIFFKFDKLLLLCNGQVGYFGESQKVIDFFADLDMHLEPYGNPADFVVDKLKEDTATTKMILDAAASRQRISEEPAPTRSGKPSSATNGVHQTDSGSVHVSFENLPSEDLFEDDSKWPTGFCTQYTQLMFRTFQQSKSRIFDKTKIFEYIIMTLLVSLIWFQLPRTEETLTDRMGALFFMVSQLGFGPLFDAASSFPSERVVIHKERSAGWYRLSAYYLAKTTSELPLTLVMPALFITVCYWCVGLNPGFAAYLTTLLIALTNTLTGQSVGLFLGIAFMDFRRAIVTCTVTIMFMMLLGGFYTRHLPVWLGWIKYFAFPYYSFHSMLLTEFTDADPLSCLSDNSTHLFQECASPNVTSVSPDRVLDYLDVNWSLAGYYLPLWLFILGLRTVGYFLLRFVHSPSSA